MQIHKLQNKDCTYSNHTGQKQGQDKISTDPRFSDDNFCLDVLTVMDHLGIEQTCANFQKYDQIFNWQAMAEDIANPLRVAKCYLLWGKFHKNRWASENDRRIYNKNKPVIVYKELRGKTPEQALEKLDTRAYEFIEWWL